MGLVPYKAIHEKLIQLRYSISQDLGNSEYTDTEMDLTCPLGQQALQTASGLRSSRLPF